MAEQSVHLHTLSGGEVSIDALARVDQEKLAQAAEIEENILPALIGRGRFRPGTEHLDSVYLDAPSRIIPFVRSLSETALLELTDGVLRVWVDDELVTRSSVSATVANGDFEATGSWTLTNTDGAESDIDTTAPGRLFLRATAAGSTAKAEQAVATTSTGTEHALRIEVDRGPVSLRVGSSTGLDDLIGETSLETGVFSLAFTPQSSPFYIQLFTRRQTTVLVSSCEVESSGVMVLDAPWVAEDLSSIKWDQSIDVTFLTHPSWSPRKIERRGPTSWGVCEYKQSGGPFSVGASAQLTLTPSDNEGNITITASGALFSEDDVGRLIKITHARTEMTCRLAGGEQYTEAFKVQGVGADHEFALTVSGTWTGSVKVQRSFLGPELGFTDTNSIGSNGSTSGYNTGTDMDNQVVWFRVGFTAASYTSGSANVRVTYGGYGSFGIARVTSYSSATEVFAEVLKRFWNTYASTQWQLGTWRGGDWPTSNKFHDGRLWFGSSNSPVGSVADDFYDFSTQMQDSAGNYAVTDDASIQRDIAVSGGINEVTDMVSLQRLVMLTDGQEITARADAFDRPLTPTVCQFKPTSTIGSTSVVSPVKMDKRAFYINAVGDRLYQLLYNFQQQDYDSDNLMELNEYILSNGPAGGCTAVDMAVQRHPDSYVWIVRSDGQLVGMLFSEKQTVTCWFRYVTDGEIERVAVLPVSNTEQRIYVVVKRTINGVTRRYLEKFAKSTEALGAAVSKQLDAGKYVAGPTSTLSVPHLAGETVYVWANGANLGSFTADSSGNVALGASYSNIWVGLGYEARYKTAKLAYGARQGSALLKKKNVAEIGLLCSYVVPEGVFYGPTFTDGEMYAMPVPGEGLDLGGADALQTTLDETTFPFSGNWDTDARVCLKVMPNNPVTFNGLVINMDTNEG